MNAPGASHVSVSVIVPTKDRPALLREALSSIRAVGAPQVDVEIVVVNNGAEDGIEELAHEFGARYTRILTPGPSAARNAGLQICAGEYVAFLDDDDLWAPGHLIDHLAFLDRHAGFDAAVGQVVRTDPAGNPLEAPYPETLPVSGKIFARILMKWLQIGALVARTSAIRRLGGFDETLVAGEDWDLLLRLALSSKIGFIPKPSVIFRSREPGSDEEDSITRFRAAINSRVFLMNVHRAGSQRPPILQLARGYLRYLGIYVASLVTNTEAHLRQGRRASARRALIWAFQISPLHMMYGFVVRSRWRRVMFQALRP